MNDPPGMANLELELGEEISLSLGPHSLLIVDRRQTAVQIGWRFWPRRGTDTAQPANEPIEIEYYNILWAELSDNGTLTIDFVIGEPGRPVNVTQLTYAVPEDAVNAVPDDAVPDDAVPDDAVNAVPDDTVNGVPEDAANAVPGDAANAVPGDAANAVPGDAANAVPGDAANGVPGDTANAVPEDAVNSNSNIVGAWIETLLSRSYGLARPRKRVVVIINPKAGPGGASKTYDRFVKPIFDAARLSVNLVTTTHIRDAVTIAQNLDVDNVDAVVACSGDGLPHEVFNGLGKRVDARRALSSVAVTQIPCGSGNAMSCNLFGTNEASRAALAVVKGVPTPLDLVSVTQDGDRTLSFLSQAMGIVADLDLGTESLRFLGQHRFILGFLWLVLNKKVYPCDVAVRVEIDTKEKVKAHYRNYQVPGGGGQALSEAPNDDDGPGLPPLRYGTDMDELPEGWELIPQEKLSNFYCGNMALMAPDANFFSAALPNDGLMDLLVMGGDISRKKAIEIQLSMENGDFFDHPLVSYRKISGYRVVPRNVEAGSYISIDGERSTFGPFQAEVHRGLGLTLSRKGRYVAAGPKGWDATHGDDDGQGEAA